MIYKYDLFISYESSADDKNEMSKHWIASFIEYAEVLLTRLLKRTPNIIISDNLDSKSSADVLNQTAVFLSIVSYETIISNNYLKELELIAEVLKGQTNYFQNERLVRIERSCIPHEDYPDILKSGKSFNFCSVAPDENIVFNLKELDVATPGAVYWMKLVELIYYIKDKIVKLQQTNGAEIVKENKLTLFLAETTQDQLFRRDLLKLELQHAGFNVVPEGNLPSNATQLKTKLNEYLQEAVMSIHIIGNEYGSYIQDSIFSMIDFQNRHVADYQKECKQKHVPEKSIPARIIWIPPGLRIVDERQSMYVEQLQRNSELAEGAEIITQGSEKMKNIVFQKLESFQDLLDNNSNDQLLSEKSIYLISNNRNLQEISEIRQFFGGRGFKILELIDKNIKKVDEYALHKRNLLHCDGVFILYCKPDLQWFESLLRDLIKVSYLRSDNPFKFKILQTDQETANLQKSLFQGIFRIKKVSELHSGSIRELIEPQE